MHLHKVFFLHVEKTCRILFQTAWNSKPPTFVRSWCCSPEELEAFYDLLTQASVGDLSGGPAVKMMTHVTLYNIILGTWIGNSVLTCTDVSWVSWFAICRLSVEIVSVRQSEVPLQTRWICYVKTFWISLQNYSFCTKKCRKCRRHPTSHRIWQSSSLNSERMWVNCSDLMMSSMKCWCKHAREIWNTSTADWLLSTSLQNQVQVCFLILGTDFHAIRHLKVRWASDKTLLRLHLTREKAGGWTGHRPVYDVGKRFQQTMHDTIIIQTGTVWTQGGSRRRTFPARIHIRHPKVRESMNMTHNMHRSPWLLGPFLSNQVLMKLCVTLIHSA